MNPLLLRTVTALALSGTAVGLVAAGQSEITGDRLTRSLTSVYTNLYLQQAQILGRTTVTATSMAALTTCDRGGPAVQDEGPGSDWVCHVLFTDPDGVRQDGSFEITVRSNGCYAATGPARLNGPLMISDATGQLVLNPVFEFDACFNPRG